MSLGSGGPNFFCDNYGKFRNRPNQPEGRGKRNYSGVNTEIYGDL
jgi:hypothetical protein